MLQSSFKVVFDVARQLSVSTSRSISTFSWRGKPVYKDGSPEQKSMIDATFEAAAKLSFNSHGADEGVIAPTGWHNHNPGGFGRKWITVQYINAAGNVLWHMKQDGTEWDRLHIYEDLTDNEAAAEKPVRIFTKPA